MSDIRRFRHFRPTAAPKLPVDRQFAAAYYRETGRHVLVAESGRSVDHEYVDWLEEKLRQVGEMTRRIWE